MPPELTYLDNEALLAAAQQGDKGSLEQLYELNQGLVRMIVERFRHSPYDYEELFQVGSIGLIKAAENFDSAYQVKFSTYAVPLIIGEIKKFLRDDGPVKVQRSVKENYQKIRWAEEHLRVTMKKEPSMSELSEFLSLSQEDIVFALDACQMPAYLHEVSRSDSPKSNSLLDRLVASDDNQLLLEKIALEEALEQLPLREKEILHRRFFKDETQSDIARGLGISQVQVSRLEKSALLKLKGWLESKE